MNVEQVKGSDSTFRINLDRLDQGWSTRSFPHLINDRQLTVADNIVFNRDGLISKRPGNAFFAAAGGGLGTTGTGAPVISGVRFYPVGAAPQLIVQSGGKLFRMNDTTGAATEIASGFSTTQPATFEQVYDPNMSTGAAVALVICDGVRIPYLYDGTNCVPVTTGAGFLPNNQATNVPIRPKYVKSWKYNLAYAGDPDDPCGIWISDALEPEVFNGYGIVSSAGARYTAYYPAGRSSNLGVITGIESLGPHLLVFFTAGIAIGYNSGTYGAFEFQFEILSAKVGCPSPRSITAFGSHIKFFGGDRFYATDTQTVVPLPDEIPSVYANSSISTFPPEIKDKTTVIGARYGQQYFASYDATGAGPQTVIACFDSGANGGWQFGAATGGTWSKFPTGMPLAFGFEARGPGERDFRFHWGSSLGDVVATYDTGNYDDFGEPIAIDIRTKAFFLERPAAPKFVQAMQLITAFPIPFGSQTGTYTDLVTPYVYIDRQQLVAPPLEVNVQTGGAAYDGSTPYDGTATYGGSLSILTIEAVGYPQQVEPSFIIQPGCMESSKNPFNLIAIVLKVTIDEPNAT